VDATLEAAMKRIVSLLLVLPALFAGCGTRPIPASAPLSADEAIAPDVSLLRGRFVAGAQPDGNTLLLRGRDGLLVFDTGRHAAHTHRILAAAHALRLPVVAIVNSHWHLDHVSGNAVLRAAYPRAQVFASDAIRDAMHGFLADYRGQLAAMIDQAPADSSDVAGWREEIARIDAGDTLFPTHPVTGDGDARIAGRGLRLGLERNAVSGGDVWMLDQRSGVLAAGDLVTLPAPLLDTACARGWSEALRRLDALVFTRLVPGHGASMSHAQFTRYRHAFDRLLACAASDAGAGACRDGWMQAVDDMVPQTDGALAMSLLDYYIAQVLRAPEPRRSRYCHAPAAP
jgi:glyoxylase-like metal-dependent hydrolase (beta-lactamase superfamily II)